MDILLDRFGGYFIAWLVGILTWSIKSRLAKRAHVVTTCLAVLRSGASGAKHPLHALQLSGAADLPSNADCVAVCTSLVRHGFPHPFTSIPSLIHVPKRKWLAFIREATSRGATINDEYSAITYLLYGTTKEAGE